MNETLSKPAMTTAPAKSHGDRAATAGSHGEQTAPASDRAATAGSCGERTSRRLPKPSDVLFATFTGAVIAVYLELFRECVGAFEQGGAIGLLSLQLTARSALFLVTFFILATGFLAALHLWKAARRFLFTWRYPIALVAFALLVALQISGSSIALWDIALAGTNTADLQGVILGMPRLIRSDEWMVFTPLGLSQEYAGYSAVSDLPRGVPTDLTLIYAQPAYAVATLFRPFFLGYLVLGSAYGLSFFWCGRMIALFLVSFEFGRFVTGDNRRLALAYALLVSFAPIVQWWFSVNGCAELLVFGQGIVLSFSAWMRSGKLAHSIAFAALFAYCTTGFVLVIYPAWQVCVGYLVAALCIAEIVSCRSRGEGLFDASVSLRSRLRAHLAPLAGALALCALCLAAVLLSSLDVIGAVSHTAYPGSRAETGGGAGLQLFNWVYSLFIPLDYTAPTPNACESAAFFSLFPLGIVLAALSLRTRRDPVVVALLAVEAVLLAYGLVGFPGWLAKVTLLSQVTVNRLPYALGLADTILLVRALSQGSVRTSPDATGRAPSRSGRRIPSIVRTAIAALFGCAAAVLFAILQPDLSHLGFLTLSAAIAFLSCLAALSALEGGPRGKLGKGDGGARMLCVAVIVAVAGLCVNPVQQGTAALSENEALAEASQIAAENPNSRWIADDSPLGQALVASGVATVNSVALYPDLETWRALDPDGAYEDVYNRYAHIAIIPTLEETTFDLTSPDAFTVHVNVDDLEKLGVDFWLSRQDLSAYDTASTAFEPIASCGPLTVFRMENPPRA